MITLALAHELKRAGLVWQPQTGDCFAIPDRGLDNRRFYITNMAIRVEMLQGHATIMFQGAYEWALDYIFLTEVVWMPTEGQLREAIEARMSDAVNPQLSLRRTPDGYICEIADHGNPIGFPAEDAVSAYGQALLHLLLPLSYSPSDERM